HQGDQALAAGQDFSVVAVSRQPRQRIINTRRPDVLKRCGFHTLIAPFAQPPGTRLTGQLQGPCVAFARRAGTATATTCLLLSRSFGVASQRACMYAPFKSETRGSHPGSRAGSVPWVRSSANLVDRASVDTSKPTMDGQ